MKESLRIALILALALALVLIDLQIPLGVGIGMLYGGIVLLATGSAVPWLPFAAAAIATVLIPVGGLSSPLVEGVPMWVGISNRLLSICVVWISFVFLRERRRTQDILQRARDELDMRVQERTTELLQMNKALVAEINERIETEASLRKSDAELETSQRALQQSQIELRALTARLLRAQDEERRRISRDLHDDINQRLAMIVVELVAIERRYPAVPESLASRLRSLQDNVTELSEDLRYIAYQFHPSVLDDLGLSIALRRLVDDFAARTGVKATLHQEKSPEFIPQPVATCFYRIAQESLSNVAKHANATEVDVEFSGEEDLLSLEIKDNGMGFNVGPKQANGSLGLVSMKERAYQVRGTLDLDSKVGRGTTIRVKIPLIGVET
ncbi:MAG: sensor histidine kinase [Nitrospira sp.]